MAFQIEIEDPHNTAPIPAAYSRVVEFNVNLAGSIAGVRFHTHESAEARHAGKRHVAEHFFTIGPSEFAELLKDPNVKQAYDLLRTAIYNRYREHPQFAGAVDV